MRPVANIKASSRMVSMTVTENSPGPTVINTKDNIRKAKDMDLVLLKSEILSIQANGARESVKDMVL